MQCFVAVLNCKRVQIMHALLHEGDTDQPDFSISLPGNPLQHRLQFDKLLNL